jgi:hypothetical protein
MRAPVGGPTGLRGHQVMSTIEAVQLGVCLLLPLSYIGLLLWTSGRQHGRTPRQIMGTLAAIVACVLGIVAIGITLSVLRGGGLIEIGRGAGRGLSLPRLEVSRFRPLDALGLAACAGLLLVALRVAKRLTAPSQQDGGPDASPSGPPGGG